MTPILLLAATMAGPWHLQYEQPPTYITHVHYTVATTLSYCQPIPDAPPHATIPVYVMCRRHFRLWKVPIYIIRWARPPYCRHWHPIYWEPIQPEPPQEPTPAPPPQTPPPPSTPEVLPRSILIGPRPTFSGSPTRAAERRVSCPGGVCPAYSTR